MSSPTKVPRLPSQPPSSGAAGAGPPDPIGRTLYQLLVDSVTDYAIFALDPQGRVMTWNEGAARLKGYSESEILGKSFSIFYPPNDREQGRPEYELKVAAAEGRHEDEGWRVRKDGTLFWANVIITALRDENGRLVGFGKVTRDLTERRNGEEALRLANDRYRSLVQDIVDYAICALDERGRIMTWNAGAHRILGYDREEVLGESFGLFFLPDDVASGKPMRELEIARREGRFEDEGWRRRKDGSRFWTYSVVTALRDTNGKIVGFSKVMRDMTQQRQQAERLARVNKDLEAFNYMVAHDLRAPIRAVRHLAGVINEDFVDKVPDEVREYSTAIVQSSDEMIRLVESLLAFGRSSSAPLDRKSLDVARLAKDAFHEAVIREVPRREIEFVAPEKLFLDADSGLLRIVLDNLIQNAVKFTRETPHPRIEIKPMIRGGARGFCVVDNGLGFDPSQASELFTPFHRLEGARAIEGSGIGLATVRRIAERHGGDAWAESPGKNMGAVFCLTLEPVPPLANRPPPAP